MSRLQRVWASVPLTDVSVTPDRFIPIFHDWIRRGAVEGMLIDVARYGHVHHGPGVMLIGHDGDYSVDMAGGNPRLRYTLKRDVDGTPAELVGLALRRLVGAAREAALEPEGAVDWSDLTVAVADRLNAPNISTTHSWLLDAITTGAREALENADVTATLRATDSRGPVEVAIGEVLSVR